MADKKAVTPSKSALVLHESIGAPTVFPGTLPGVFFPGVPVTLAQLGLTEREATLMIQDGLPLVLTKEV